MQGGGTINGWLGDENGKKSVSPYKVGWWQQFKAVLKRSVLANTREPMVLRTKVFQMIIVSLLLGVIYLDQEMTQEGITNINGALFLILTQISFSNTMGVVNTFCTELPIFLREHFNGMYRTDVYFISKNLAELPLTIFLPLLFVSIVYYMIGLYAPAENFFICAGLLILVANAAVSFGYMISCLARNLNIALAIAAPLLIPLMLFGGLFLNVDSIPVYFIWIRYISWFNYGNEALIINQWQNVKNITCPPDQIPDMCALTGEDVIEDLSFNKNNLGLDVGLLFVIIIGFRFIGFLLLLLKTKRKAVQQID
uniref:ABC-2 type transporter transmembrane domain-containing protein n=2 Tax=Scylla olivacea TaxID=85551 RepID=A0A0P4VZS6_SCYOL